MSAVADGATILGLRATLVADGVSELRSRDALATAVATDGVVAVVGAPAHDIAGADAGAAFIYRRVDGEWLEEAQLIPSDPGANDGFGTAVAVAGDTMVVGAPRAAASGGDWPGAVYVFAYDGTAWQERNRLTAPSGAEGDAFGTAVALAAGRLVVGAPRTDGEGSMDSGAAHIFERAGDDWIHQATLTPTSPVASGRFGSAVAVSADRIAVGTPRADAGAPAAGSVSVFMNDGDWIEEQELSCADAAPGDAFGSSIVIRDEILAIGAPESAGTGAAYVFERSGGTWTERVRLVPTGASGDDAVGRSVALFGASLIVGAPGAGTGGRAFVYTGAGASWQELSALQAATGGNGSSFGLALAVSSDTLLVGAPGDRTQGINSGAAWAFSGSGADWDGGIRLGGAGTAAYDLFGIAVAIDGDTAVVGAQGEDVGSLEEAGAVYVFTREAGSWIRQARLVASDPSAGAQLGTDVDVSGDTIVAGAWLADGAVSGGGAVYVFERDGESWSEVARLAPATLEESDYFGRAVSLSGDTLVATAAGGSTVYVHRKTGGEWALEDTLHPFPKPAYPLLISSVDVSVDVVVIGARVDDAAYIYERAGNTWSERARLISPSGQDEDFFGDPVAVDGNTVAVGAPLENVAGQLDAGAVYLYRRDGASWSLDQRLQSPTPGLEDAFGVGLDLSGETMVVGAPFNRTSGPGAGYGVVFGSNGSSWQPTAVITDPTGQAGAQFGFSVAMSSTSLVVGAWSCDRPPGTPDQGAAYVFEETAVPSDAPRARLSFLPVDPAAGQAVQFIDSSSGSPTSWFWDLGDGATSVDPNPRHVYQRSGSYEVQLLVSNDFGQDSTAATVVVRDPAEPGFSPNIAIAAVARVEGAGAFFSSRLELFNRGTGRLLINAVYTPRIDVGGAARATTVELLPGILLELDDPLGDWFGLAGEVTGVGSLMLGVVDGDPSSLLTYSVVFARNRDGSEYGQLFPAVAGDGGFATGESALLATSSDAAHNRVNLGVMALAGDTRVRITPVDPIGHPLGSSRTVDLALGGSQQLNNVHQVFGLDPAAEDFVLAVEVQRGRATAYASVIDGVGASYPGTNDPTTILPLLGAERSTLLALGPVSGLNEFSGSASICNLDDAPATISASFFARDDGASGPARSATVVVEAGDSVGYQDLVGELFGVEGVGTVVLEAPSGSRIAAVGREFSLQEDGAGAVIGRAGQLIRGLGDHELLRPGTTFHLLGLRQIDATPVPERSNIVAFNPGDAAVRLTLRLYDGASGSLEGEQTYPVPAQDLRQINSVIAKINPAQDGEVKRIEVEVDGPLFVQAIRANRDGDPITIDPLPPPATP